MSLLLVSATLALGTAVPWAAEPGNPHHQALAVTAASLLPPSERALLLAHEEALRNGAAYPDFGMDAWKHREDPTDPEWGGAVEATLSAYESAVLAFREDRMEDAAYDLGLMSHFVLDLSQPMHSGGGWDAIANDWHSSYEEDAQVHERSLRLGAVLREAPALRAPDVVAREVNERAHAAWPALEDALAASDGAWSADVRAITEDMLTVGLRGAADLMHSAMVEGGVAPESAAAPVPDSRAPGAPVAVPIPPGREGADASEALTPTQPLESVDDEAESSSAAAWAVAGAALTVVLLAASLARKRPRDEER